MQSNHIVRLTIAAAVLAAIGCADGQRSNSYQKGKQFHATMGPGGGPSKATPGTTKTDALTTVLPGGGDPQAEQTIKTYIAQLESGLSLSTQMDPADYELKGWTTYYASSGPWVQAMKKTNFVSETARAASATVPVGQLNPNTPASSVAIVIPARFGISANNAAQTDTADRMLVSTISLKDKSISLDDAIGAVDAQHANTAASLEKILMSKLQSDSFVADVGDNTTFELKGISKPSVQQVIIALILNKNKGEVMRTFYLTYEKVAKTNVPKQNPAPTQTEPAADATGGPVADGGGVPDEFGPAANQSTQR